MMLAAPSLAASGSATGQHDAPHALPSLFILSLPRSLSSLVHTTCCKALGLQSPSWTSDGEILNVERSTFLSDQARGAKYTQAHQPHLFRPATEFLTEVVQASGFCYKDVTQPFVTGAWLRTRSDIRVLKIVPNIAHVSLAMTRRLWLYPTMAAQPGLGAIPDRLVSGLTRAAVEIAAVPGESICFDDLLTGAEPLRQALARLYPGTSIPQLDFGVDFAAGRSEVLGRRELPAYKAMAALASRFAGTERAAA